MPAILLTPTGLSATASQLFKSMELRDTTSNSKYPVSNPHQGKFRVEVSRYLANASYTGSSAKAWYLLAEPADLPVIEVAFLNGQESPTIETAEADAYATSLREAVELCIKAAKGELKSEEAEAAEVKTETPAPATSPAEAKPKREPKGKSQTAAA